MRLHKVLRLVVVLLLASTALDAHHSYADFEDRTVSVGGIIDRIMFVNPHVILTVRTKDSTVYTMTWSAATNLMNHGVGREDLKVGDEVTVSGSPSRKSAELSKITEIRRTRDGWSWSQTRLGAKVVAPL